MQYQKFNASNLGLTIENVFGGGAVDWPELINLKVLLGTYLSNLERVFRGVFGQELELEGTAEQFELFKNVFPVMGEAIEKSFGQPGFGGFCKKLSAIRNTCLHAYSDIHGKTGIIDRNFINSLPNYGRYKYVDDSGNLTLAGLMAILLCLGNKEMVQQLMVSGVAGMVGRIGLWPCFEKCGGRAYPDSLETQLGNDFEETVRRSSGDDIYSSIWGEYENRCWRDGERFSYSSNRHSKRSIYHVSGTISTDETVLFIEKGSYYHVYFADNYELTIEDKDYFIQLSNSVPPFLFVVYLYRKGVRVFSKSSLDEREIGLIPKLNKAKFYVDKNVNTLLLGKTVSDQRTVHQAALPQALYAIINLEKNLIDATGVVYENGYSTIKGSLGSIGVDEKLIEDTLILRNFLAHGAIFGDYATRDDFTYRKIELLDCLDVFKRLVVSLKPLDARSASSFKYDVACKLAEQLIDMKYKAMSKLWNKAYEGEPIDWEAYQKSMGRVKYSYVNAEVEESLAWFKGPNLVSRYYVTEIESIRKMEFRPTFQELPAGGVTIITTRGNAFLDECFGARLDSFGIAKKRKNSLVAYQRLVEKKPNE